MFRKKRTGSNDPSISYYRASHDKKDSVNYHAYFRDHKCYIPYDKLSAFSLALTGCRRYFFKLICLRSDDMRSLNMYRSYAALCAEKNRHYKKYLPAIHPFSRLRLRLEALVVLFIIVSPLFLTLNYCTLHYNIHQPYRHLIFYCDIIYMLHVVFNFFTGYIKGKSNKIVVMSLGKIFLHYVTTWFLLDLLAACGFVSDLVQPEEAYWYLVLECLKIPQLIRLKQYMKNIMISFRISSCLTNCVEFCVFVFVYIWWNMYFQFAIEFVVEGTFNPKNPRNCSWLTEGHLLNVTSSVRLVYSFQRAVSMLTSNTNRNVTNEIGCYATFFVVAWFISKILIFHFIIRHVLEMFSIEAPHSKYYLMTRQLKTYLSQKKFPPRLKEKILKFYALRFQNNFIAEDRILECVSGRLQHDILMHTGRQLVKEIEFLKHLPESLLMHIALKLKLVIFIAGDIIFKINTVGDCLYFIDKGTVAVYSGSGCEVCHFEDGQFFGEIELIMKQRFCIASVVAVTNCELFRLDKQDFFASLAYYPTVYENFKRVAFTRLEHEKVLEAHHKTQLQTQEQADRKMLN